RGGGKNLRGGVIAVYVQRATSGWAGWAGDAPANRGVRGAVAVDGSGKGLGCAEFDAAGAGGEGDAYVAGYGQRRGREFRFVAIASRSDLHCRGDWQIDGCGVYAGGGNGASDGTATG